MSVSEIEAICDKCGNEFESIPNTSILGFQKLRCPDEECKAKITYPLSISHIVGYLLFCLAAIWVTWYLPDTAALPGFIFIFIFFKDWDIRKRIKKLRKGGKLRNVTVYTAFISALVWALRLSISISIFKLILAYSVNDETAGLIGVMLGVYLFFVIFVIVLFWNLVSVFITNKLAKRS